MKGMAGDPPDADCSRGVGASEVSRGVGALDASSICDVMLPAWLKDKRWELLVFWIRYLFISDLRFSSASKLISLLDGLATAAT